MCRTANLKWPVTISVNEYFLCPWEDVSPSEISLSDYINEGSWAEPNLLSRDFNQTWPHHFHIGFLPVQEMFAASLTLVSPSQNFDFIGFSSFCVVNLSLVKTWLSFICSIFPIVLLLYIYIWGWSRCNVNHTSSTSTYLICLLYFNIQLCE